MSEFVLSHTATSEHRITFDKSQITLSQSDLFTFDAQGVEELIWFLQDAKTNWSKTERHTYTGQTYILDYDPTHGELYKFQIIHRSSGRIISMARSTAWKLHDALTGKTE
jgi:hypothetical protein